jgi:hypothetical protein
VQNKSPPKLPQATIDALRALAAQYKISPEMQSYFAKLAKGMARFQQSPAVQALRESLQKLQLKREAAEREAAEQAEAKTRAEREAAERAETEAEAKRRKGGRPPRLSEELAQDAQNHLRTNRSLWWKGDRGDRQRAIIEAGNYLGTHGDPIVSDDTIDRRIVRKVLQ